jgi:hypothetical protein
MKLNPLTSWPENLKYSNFSFSESSVHTYEMFLISFRYAYSETLPAACTLQPTPPLGTQPPRLQHGDHRNLSSHCGTPRLLSNGWRGLFPLGVKRPEREADYSPPSSVEVMNAWTYTSTPQYVFVAWCLIKHRKTLLLPYFTLITTSKNLSASRSHTHTHTHTYTYIHTYMFICVR